MREEQGGAASYLPRFLLRSCYDSVAAIGYDEVKHEMVLYQQ